MIDRAELKKIPKQSGIYQFFNADGEIIYIGKSVNLASRVSSYFTGKKHLNFAKKKMVGQVVRIETMIVNNETESLILETNLIKQHRPKYNVLMKDDKNHLYIKITGGTYPKVIKTRIAPASGLSKYNKNYFGPYISGNSVNNILKILKNYFGYGIANHHFFQSKNSYNLDKYLFDGNVTTSDEKNIQKLYEDKIGQMRQFLSGDFSQITQDLSNKMSEYVKELKFEQAGEIKKYLLAIENIKETQVVRDGIKGNYDIFNYIEKNNKYYIGLICIRDSKIIGYYNFEIENKLGEDKNTLISEVLQQRYAENKQYDCHVTYLLSEDGIQTGIGEIDRHIEIPKLGAKHDLIKLCYKNIYEYAHKKHLESLSTKSFSQKNMLTLLDTLGYQKINKEIIFECNDISHLSGSHTVASRSIINNGKKDTSKYKKFSIKSLGKGKVDDFGSMREIMTRRLKEIEKTKKIPDLIVIDGGKGQLSSVVKVIEDFETEDQETKDLIDTLQIVSIAKKEEELFIQRDGKFQKYVLDLESSELRMIQSIRDEAHRFAITFNRSSRIKSMKKNILESIPGIGPKNRKKILSLYGSLEGLKEVSKKELEGHFNKNILQALEDHGII